jgi:hypothetical protein
VRRSPAIILASALLASALAVSTWSAASAEPPGDTPDTGSFYVSPDPPTVGETVQLTGNFPSGTFMVTFYKRTGADTWTSIGNDQSNSSGNAYLSTHKVNEQEDLYARITSGGTGRTEVKTVTPTPAPVVAPTGPDVGSLYQAPESYAEGDLITITANFPSGTFPITLYRESAPDVWTAIGTKTSNSSGNASFSNFKVEGTQKLFARKANNERTEVDEIKASPRLTLSVRRDCSGNDCDGTATAYGEFDPVVADRPLTLQRLSGSSWVSVAGAVAGTTGADGKVEIQFPLAGIPQWTTRTYRLRGEADASNPAVTSNTIQFMPGPTKLGVNVLRVDVEKGVYPTSKANEYTGDATLSVNGEVTLQDVALENFGVRGNSTANYTKKPYKLKFLASPKPTTVFGMEPDRSWTLLAGYLDQTFVREKVGLDLGRRMTNIAWTPDSRYVEMFVNDQYRGSYIMTESVKIDGDRVDVGGKTGMIMEVDNSIKSGTFGFVAATSKTPFIFKDPDERKPAGDPDFEEGVTDAKLAAVKSRITAFESKLYSSSGRAEYKDFLDEPAAIDFHLVKEFTKDNDSDFFSSHYFSWDQKIDTTAPLNPLQDNRFHFGPAWDFDRSAGNVDPDTSGHRYVRSPEGWMMRGTGTPSDSGRTRFRTHWFVQLFKIPAFEAAVEARWDTIKDQFKEIGDSHVAKLRAEVGVGAENDRKRWANEKKRYLSNGSLADEIAYVTKWYKDRFTWMNGQLSN